MFTYTHIIWIAISILIIVAMLLISKFLKMSNKTVLTIMCVVSALSEIVKISLNMIDGVDGGKVLSPGSLPFHLCSIQIFFIFGLRFFIKKESVKKVLYNFMVPTSLIGASMSLLIPTIGTSFAAVQVYQYFIYHAFLIFYGVYLIREHLAVINVKTLFINYGLLLIIVLFDLWINSFLSFWGANFMYLTKPPMENLPILNLDNGWYVYIISLLVVGTILMVLFHMPFIIVNRHKKTN